MVPFPGTSDNISTQVFLDVTFCRFPNKLMVVYFQIKEHKVAQKT